MPERDWLDELEELAERLTGQSEKRDEPAERPQLVLIQGGRDDA